MQASVHTGAGALLAGVVSVQSLHPLSTIRRGAHEQEQPPARAFKRPMISTSALCYGHALDVVRVQRMPVSRELGR